MRKFSPVLNSHEVSFFMSLVSCYSSTDVIKERL